MDDRVRHDGGRRGCICLRHQGERIRLSRRAPDVLPRGLLSRVRAGLAIEELRDRLVGRSPRFAKTAHVSRETRWSLAGWRLPAVFGSPLIATMTAAAKRSVRH